MDPTVAQETQDENTSEAEVAQVATQVQLGITYTESCTLEQAIEAYEAALGFQMENRADFLSQRQGMFKFRRPSAMDSMRMDLEFDQMAKGAALSMVTESQMRAYLTVKHLLTEKPKWFALEEETEPDVFLLLNYWYTEWSRSFRGRLVTPR